MASKAGAYKNELTNHDVMMRDSFYRSRSTLGLRWDHVPNRMSPMPFHRRTVSRQPPTSTLLILALVLGAALPGCVRAGTPIEDGLYMRTHLSSAMFLWIEMIYISGDRIAWHASGGVDPFDFAAAEKNDSKNVGHFKINGDEIEVGWDGGKSPQKMRLEFKQGKVSAIDAGGIIKAAPYPKGGLDASFEGNIGPKDALTGVQKPATLTLTKDGKCSLFPRALSCTAVKSCEKTRTTTDQAPTNCLAIP
jgi:hypothetical protein